MALEQPCTKTPLQHSSSERILAEEAAGEIKLNEQGQDMSSDSDDSQVSLGGGGVSMTL